MYEMQQAKHKLHVQVHIMTNVSNELQSTKQHWNFEWNSCNWPPITLLCGVLLAASAPQSRNLLKAKLKASHFLVVDLSYDHRKNALNKSQKVMDYRSDFIWSFCIHDLLVPTHITGQFTTEQNTFTIAYLQSARKEPMTVNSNETLIHFHTTKPTGAIFANPAISTDRTTGHHCCTDEIWHELLTSTIQSLDQ